MCFRFNSELFVNCWSKFDSIWCAEAKNCKCPSLFEVTDISHLWHWWEIIQLLFASNQHKKLFSKCCFMFCFSSACVAFWPVVCFVQRMEFNYEKRTKLAWCQANTPSDMLLITSHVQLFLLLGRVECWPNVSNGLHIPSIKSDRFWHCRLSLASIYSLGRWDKTQFSTLCEKCLCTRQYEFIICILLTFPLFSGKRRRWWTFLPASWSAWRAEEGRCVKPLNCDFSLFLSHFFVCCVNVWCCVF